MRTRARPSNRRARRDAARQQLEHARAVVAPAGSQLEPAEQLAVAAAISLELSSEQIDEACETLFYEPERTELADMVEARVIELLQLSGYGDQPARTALEQRKGREFFSRVAAMGKPAKSALQMAEKPIAALLALVVALVLLLLPSSAAAAEARGAALRMAHKIQRRNSRWLLGSLGGFSYHFRRRGWIQSKNYYAILRRRSLSVRGSAIGCASERVSCRSRESGSRSFSSGERGASASASSRTVIRTLRSSVAMERSNSRRTSEYREAAQ
jgi:hypothetical protein